MFSKKLLYNGLNMKKALTFDDIQLIPKYSEVLSRRSVKLKTSLSKNYSIDIPIIASPMDTVCGFAMAKLLMSLGGAGCIHRFMSIDTQSELVKNLKDTQTSRDSVILAAVGANGDYLERSKELIKNGANVLIIDVAHGHHLNVKIAIDKIKSIDSKVDVIAGNIATRQSAIDLVNWGADGLRVGIGGGSLCTTRVQTGFGIPNVTAIQECSILKRVPIMADGGIRSSGDIAKALAVGADCVMLGSLLAGTTESPGLITIDENGNSFKKFRGSASLDIKKSNNKEIRNIEGESTVIPHKGSAKNIILHLIDGIKSALSYTGALNLKEYHEDVEFVEVTNSGKEEGRPHLLS
jgi:IMP dehydrogenase